MSENIFYFNEYQNNQQNSGPATPRSESEAVAAAYGDLYDQIVDLLNWARLLASPSLYSLAGDMHDTLQAHRRTDNPKRTGDEWCHLSFVIDEFLETVEQRDLYLLVKLARKLEKSYWSCQEIEFKETDSANIN